MNGCVAHGARLVLRRLIVSGASRPLNRECVALQAQQVYLVYPQEPWVCRPVWRMTTGATLGFDGHMLIRERALLVGVALEADGISTRQRSQLADGRRAMRVVTIAALDETFINPVVIRLRKVGFGGRMTPVAEIGLRSHQQRLGFPRVVRGVAIQAADIVVGMRR